MKKIIIFNILLIAIKLNSQTTISSGNVNDYWIYGGKHIKDVYFSIPLSTRQYYRLQNKLQSYADGSKRSPNYGFFGKRCTSMANHYLRKSGIKLAGWNFIQRKVNTLYPGAYYNRLIKLGFKPIKAR